jgi:hypothetical protein
MQQAHDLWRVERDKANELAKMILALATAG